MAPGVAPVVKHVAPVEPVVKREEKGGCLLLSLGSTGATLFTAGATLGATGATAQAAFSFPRATATSAAAALAQALAMSVAQAVALHRRLRGKQAAPAAYVLNAAAYQAIVDEGWHELAALGDDVRRKHVHWVHVKTGNPDHRQPSTLSREEFWEHVCQCYREAYPEDANPTKSILLFGIVARERHHNSQREQEREVHTHFIAYCSMRHYWRVVAEISLRKYHVKLHCAAHEGYTTMYAYIRCPTPKKPLSELDPSPYWSPQHPQGELLQRLLQAGAHADRANRGRKQSSRGGDQQAESRFRAGDLYSMVQRTGIRTALAFRAHAQDLASNGDSSLAEFCTVAGVGLQEKLDAAWAVHDAPRALVAAAADRVGKLRQVAEESPCSCSGAWIPGALFVLQNNGECPRMFCHDIYRALALGAKRGVNMAIIGGPGMGKSTVLEPLDDIFVTSAKPQRDSSFPLEGILGAEVLLWQEFTYSKRTLAWEDLLALLVGEKLAVRCCGTKPVQHRNAAPMFYTARQHLCYHSMDPHEMMDYNQAMLERFTTRRWTVPLPPGARNPDFPRCGRCFSRFVLQNERDFQSSSAVARLTPSPERQR